MLEESIAEIPITISKRDEYLHVTNSITSAELYVTVGNGGISRATMEFCGRNPPQQPPLITSTFLKSGDTLAI